MSSFLAPLWLRGGHAQTIYAALLAPRAPITYRRERWDTPDGDFIDLDWLVNPARDPRRINLSVPLVVLFHGLEGSSRSHYSLALMAALRSHGMRGVTVHFRGCSGELNRLPRAYHSGDAREIDWILRRFRAQSANAPLFAVGVSLGGNALLKWLGETGADARAIVQKTAAVSAPVDLTAAGEALGRGFNLVYARHFLRSMKQKALAKLSRHPGIYDSARVRAAFTLRAFDDLVTAPLHGFRNTDDYWTRASSKPGLRNIRVPTLILNARNDPFLPPSALPGPGEVSGTVTLEQPEHGGHVGFVTGPFPGNLHWLPQRVLEFLGVSTEKS